MKLRQRAGVYMQSTIYQDHESDSEIVNAYIAGFRAAIELASEKVWDFKRDFNQSWRSQLTEELGALAEGEE